jgi:hypothetical protein
LLFERGFPNGVWWFLSRKNGDQVKIEDLEKDEMKFMKRGNCDKNKK